VSGRLAGKMAVITGAARGIGRAQAARFLASDEARYITAVTLPVDAGATQR
jgi:NAD(P)-dependent dehydrogenase (short-subunit alcohol dehydrogenase family)